MAKSNELDVSSDPIAVQVAVQNNDIKHMNESLARIEGILNSAIKTFVTQQQITEIVSVRNTKFVEYDKTLGKIQLEVDNLKNAGERQEGALQTKRRTAAVITTVVTIVGGFIGGLVEALILHGGVHR